MAAGGGGGDRGILAQTAEDRRARIFGGRDLLLHFC